MSVKSEDGEIDARKLEETLRDVGLSQKERKLLIAGGLVKLMNERDVVNSETKEQQLARELIKHIKGEI